MGSSCLIKDCRVKKTRAGASFHRLPWRRPGLGRALEGVFGHNNVRDLSRWSRICSLHIAQLVPAAQQHPDIRDLIDYYAWSSRSYKKLIELSSSTTSLVSSGGKLGRDDVTKADAAEAATAAVPVSPITETPSLDNFIKTNLLALQARQILKEKEKESASRSSSLSLGMHHQPPPPPLGVSDGDVPLGSAKGRDEVMLDGLGESESGQVNAQLLLQILTKGGLHDAADAATAPKGNHMMTPDDSLAQVDAMDASREPDKGATTTSSTTTTTSPNNTVTNTGKADETGAKLQDDSKQQQQQQPDISDNNNTKKDCSDSGGGGDGGGGDGSDGKKTTNNSNAGEMNGETGGGAEAGESDSVVREAAKPLEADNEVEDDDADDDDDDSKESSEEDEDKLVINEGNVTGEGNDVKVEENEENTPEARDSPSPPNSTGVKAEKRGADDPPVSIVPKRHRSSEEFVPLDSITSVSQVQSSIGQVKKDLEVLDLMLKQKEEEWNSLLRLQKRKEELHARLLRKQQVLLMKRGDDKIGVENKEGGIARAEGYAEKEGSNLLFLPQGGYSSLGGPQLPLMMMNQLLSGTTTAPQSMQVPPTLITSKTDPKASNISVIDIHTSGSKPGLEGPRVSLSSEAHSKLAKQLSMKPILPKPVISRPEGNSISPTPVGQGPQGPTINVQHLIAAHRKENPNTPPLRGAKRGAWRQKYDGEKRPRDHDRPSSVSSSSSDADSSRPDKSKGALTMNDPNVSYKDVLLQFAQMTQSEKQPGSPQISIIPVGPDGSKRMDVGSRESTPNSSKEATLIPTIQPVPGPTPTHPPTSLPMSLEGPSALAKAPSQLGEVPIEQLLLETRAGNTGGGSVKVMDQSNPQYLTLSALLSGGKTTTSSVREKPLSSSLGSSKSESRSKKNPLSLEDGTSPKCQGCHRQRAQFVCAGCGNQWYCSRECQVAAWEEHSEHCAN